MDAFSFIEVPQWQGSGTPSAPLLARGAAELAAAVPAARAVRVEVADDDGIRGGAPGARGAAPGGVAGLGLLARNLRAVRAALDAGPGGATVTAGGDCAADLAPVEAALAAHGEGLAVVWFDAHGDLNTPASSPSGAFTGMVLRTLLGEGPAELSPRQALRPEQVVLAGARALDPGERAYIAASGLCHLGVPELAEDPAAAAGAVAARGASAVYIHLDLDVLDPAHFDAVGTPEPGGLTPAALVRAIRALAARFPLAGLALAGYEAGGERARTVLKQLIADLLPVLPERTYQIEQRTARAWPAAVVEERAGWLLRATPGVTRLRFHAAALPPPYASDDAGAVGDG
ncbi:arginase family protein, partial [Streptomyces boncukensis]